MPRQVALKASMQPWTIGILKWLVLLGWGLSAGNFDCVVICFLFSYIFIFLNPPSRWCRLATIKCSKAFLALKPLYCDQSTKSTQLIKPNYFVLLLYWYSTSFLRKLPHLFLRESLVLILCSCLLLDQNIISMFWCFFPLSDFQYFFLYEPIKWTWICSFLKILFF